jgi:AMP-binding enzyme/Transposase
MNSLITAKYTAFVGLDWADAKHDICLQAAGRDRREFDCFAHRTERIEEWALALQQRFGGRIAVALELSKGPIVYALQKYDFLVLFPINPSTLAKYRQAFQPSRAKDDPVDKRVHTVGRVHPHVQVKIIDKRGHVVPVGTRGELCTRGYSVMLAFPQSMISDC